MIQKTDCRPNGKQSALYSLLLLDFLLEFIKAGCGKEFTQRDIESVTQLFLTVTIET